VAIHHVSAMHPVAISRTILLLAIMHGLIKILLCQYGSTFSPIQMNLTQLKFCF
jgi:hypothetical protein